MPRPLEDPAGLLTSLKGIGLATDLRIEDLAITSQTATQAASSSVASSSSASSRESSLLSILLSRLSLLLSDLSRQIERHVRTNLLPLLAEAGRVQELQGCVHEVDRSIAELERNVSEPRNQVSGSLSKLKRDHNRLVRLTESSSLLKEASQFVRLARSLEADLKILFEDVDGIAAGDSSGSVSKSNGTNGSTATTQAQTETSSANKSRSRQQQVLQRSREEALVRCAQGLETIEKLVSASPQLGRLGFVASYMPSIASARTQVLDTMEHSIVLGLRDLNASLLSSSLLAANSLGVLQELLQDLMNDLIDVVKKRVDVALIFADADDSSPQDTTHYASYAPSRRSQTHNASGRDEERTMTDKEHATLQKAVTALLSRLNVLITVEMTAVCSKIYLLQRVLRLMPKSQNAKAGEEVRTRSSVYRSVTTVPDEKQTHRHVTAVAAVDGDDGNENSDEWSSSEDSDDQGSLSGDEPTGRRERIGAQKSTMLEEVTSTLGDAPTLLFWRTLASCLSQRVNQYNLPLHRGSRSLTAQVERQVNHLVDLFFEKTAVWTGLENPRREGGGSSNASITTGPYQGPEKTLLLRSLAELCQPLSQ